MSERPEEEVVLVTRCCVQCGQPVTLTPLQRQWRERLGLHLELCLDCARVRDLKGPDEEG